MNEALGLPDGTTVEPSHDWLWARAAWGSRRHAVLVDGPMERSLCGAEVENLTIGTGSTLAFAECLRCARILTKRQQGTDRV